MAAALAAHTPSVASPSLASTRKSKHAQFARFTAESPLTLYAGDLCVFVHAPAVHDAPPTLLLLVSSLRHCRSLVPASLAFAPLSTSQSPPARPTRQRFCLYHSTRRIPRISARSPPEELRATRSMHSPVFATAVATTARIASSSAATFLYANSLPVSIPTPATLPLTERLHYARAL
ncbi:uncharacterized protein LAESUDRAFT_756992 [Laetiporus sulphureus 93-53]|uniref:Uncharacterized protein n=1 Tax=Laetiporus sulphureus 93-53 TaxID=1314785 RepID=A0A165FSW2_9APHY|nr:uncharacterized protein LAESUDRAFT_756992 [Laetiporus sulphureus 93-53]KZT09370.1 hypothetical protein LAESUDRAFT_756992 [Laetiporus sulphureus 93-53]